jgi:nicotinamidase-related amidase
LKPQSTVWGAGFDGGAERGDRSSRASEFELGPRSFEAPRARRALCAALIRLRLPADLRWYAKWVTAEKAMPVLDVRNSTLVVIDMQARLMPAIDEAAAAIANARRLLDAAALLGVPALFTEQNPKGLGETVPELAADESRVLSKMEFDACRAPGFCERLIERHAAVIAGAEAHVCVLQTALGLVARGRRVFVVRDAIGSRRPESADAALRRMEANGVEIVTTEMVVFEWLGDARNPGFREAVALIK